MPHSFWYLPAVLPRALALFRIGPGLVALVTLFLGGCGPKFERIPTNKINTAQKTAAETFVKTMFMAWNEGKTVDVTGQITQNWKNTSAYQEIFAKRSVRLLGKFKSMTFVEAHRSIPPQFIVYRF